MKPIYDPQTHPRSNTGLIALLTILNDLGGITRLNAIDTISSTGLTSKTAEAIIRKAGRRQAIKTTGKKHNGIDRRRLTAGPLFDQALNS